MRTAMPRWLTAVLGQLPTVLTPVTLAAVARWGHAHGWRLAEAAKDADDDEVAVKKDDDDDDKGGATRTRVLPDPTTPVSEDAARRPLHLLRIVLPSAEIAKRIGLATAAVEVRP